MKKVSRRNWIKASAGVAASAAALSFPSILNAASGGSNSLNSAFGDSNSKNSAFEDYRSKQSSRGFGSKPRNNRRKALIIGAHPDDPETIAGGTMIRLLEAGWDVLCVYLTRGEAGIKGMSGDEAAAIREKECIAACKVTGARYQFMSQVDGATEINKERYAEMLAVIKKENPEIVITHWPIDTHRDHRICSILVYDAWRQSGYNFNLFYAEAMTGMQSMKFLPTDYVDISAVAEKKHQACLCHESQGMPELLSDWHIPMEKFRGMEYGCAYAEGFIHLTAHLSPSFVEL